ncbi:MAG: TetR/AcrR family transcriptional regulator [Kineosporiaceae bacterium]
MAANPERRARVSDAALVVLGRSGGRGLTHRAVDAAGAFPRGTAANYFPTRAALLLGMTERIFDRLRPDAARLERLGRLPPDVDAVVEYIQDVVERLLAAPDLTLALLELRLEAARNTDIAAALGPFLRRELTADVAFHVGRGLPGGAESVIDLHHAVNGLVLDRVTVPLDPDADPRVVVRRIVEQLVRRGRE